MTEHITSLPFDQYSRQEIVRRIVEDFIRPFIFSEEGLDARQLKIVDFGGHKGVTIDFFKNDLVTILDVFDLSYPGYVKGDATATDFKDDEFDIVVSFDTLEHIPADKRDAFISEAARVSKYAFIVAAPFDNDSGDVSLAEEAANNTYKKIHNKDHKWLAEHIEYGIPTKKTTENSITETGSVYTNIPTNNLVLWLMTQGLMFNTSIFPFDIEEVVATSRLYNEHLSQLEHLSGDTYRQIYIGSNTQKLIDLINDKFKLEDVKDQNLTHSTVEYIETINNAYGTVIKRFHADVEYLKLREQHLQEKYDEVLEEKNAIEEKLRQIQDQSSTEESH